jgi:hypothetical protein
MASEKSTTRRIFMSLQSKRFQRKFRDCFGLTRVGAIAAAASVGIAGDGVADPVRVEVNEILPASSSKTYDINGDGRDDVTFDYSTYSDWYIDPSDYAPPGTTGNVTVGVLLDEYLIFAHGHAAGDLVPGVMTALQDAAPLHAGDTGPFYDQSSPRFAGLYLALGDTTGGVDPTVHWAWAQLNVTPDFDLEIIAFGYESDPSTSITAGDPPQSVPVGAVVPLGLGLLAAGAWMLRKKLSRE